MKVLLLRDVYKLGRAGDVKKVADGYGRNYLLPQGLAVMASEGAVKQAGKIREKAETERTRLNEELGSLAEQLEGLRLAFPVRAGETGKLYGSITTAMIAEAIETATGTTIDKRQVDSEPVKSLGVHTASIRLTIDLVPEVTLLVHREGEPPESALEMEEEEPGVDFAELRAEGEAEPESPAEVELEPAAELEEQPPDDLEPDGEAAADFESEAAEGGE